MSNESFAVFFSIDPKVFSECNAELLNRFKSWLSEPFLARRHCVYVKIGDLPAVYQIVLDQLLGTVDASITIEKLGGNLEQAPYIIFGNNKTQDEKQNPRQININDLFDRKNNYKSTPIANKLALMNGFSEVKNSCPKLFAKMAFAESITENNQMVACFWSPRVYLDFFKNLLGHCNTYSMSICVFVSDGHIKNPRDNTGRSEFRNLSPDVVRQRSKDLIIEQKKTIVDYVSSKKHIGPVIFKLIQGWPLDLNEFENGLIYHNKMKDIFHDRYLWFSKTRKHIDDFQFYKSTDYDIKYKDKNRTELETDSSKMTRVKHSLFYADGDYPSLEFLDSIVFSRGSFEYKWEEKNLRLTIQDIP